MGRASDPQQRKEEQRTAASARAASRILEDVAMRLEQLSRFVDDPADGETYLTSLHFKVGGGWDDGVLVVVKATIGGEDKVGFHGDSTLIECVRGLANRLNNGSLKWREDVPYAERDGE